MSSLLSFVSWYLVVTILGFLTFPLTYRLFPALADRGYSLSRAVGLLIWGYVFWLLTSLGVTQNDIGGLLLALVVLVGIGFLALWKSDRAQVSIKGSLSSVRDWVMTNLRLVVTIEVLFFLIFAAWAAVRATNPEIVGTEKPMELAYINAILRSPTFPPRDPWLSDYAISYYYFGYVMAAMLAKVTGTLGSIAFNLMIALLFALSTIGAYGVVYNLLTAWRQWSDQGNRILSYVKAGTEPVQKPRSSVFGLSFFGPLFLLIASNLEGFLEVLHGCGLFWPADPSKFNFWAWLNIKELNQAPLPPLDCNPERFWWWWRASRVLQDYDLAGNFREVIDEFPFFSYLLADLHPHVLAMPFGLLTVAIALNLFLGGWRGETNLFFYRLPINRPGFLFMALALGGLAFLNTWDILIGFALVIGAYLLLRVREDGWTWGRLEDLLALALPVGLLSLLMYLPFYVGFSSQAGGIMGNLDSPTRAVYIWVMFGSLLLPIFAYLVYLLRGEKRPAGWALGFGVSFGLGLLLWLFSWLLGWLGYLRPPQAAASYLAMQGMSNTITLFLATSQRRLEFIGGLLTILVLLAFSLSLLVRSVQKRTDIRDGNSPDHNPHSPLPMVLLFILLASLLVLAPEFIFLRDQFLTRMNTIFKFYYQAWLLWSLAAAFGIAVMLDKVRGKWAWIPTIGLGMVLFLSLIYPALGLIDKTNNFNPPSGWTLDGAAYLDRNYPNDAAAIRWLRAAPDGIVAEAVGGSYSDYARISTHTGLPTVLGWPGHEAQWRGGYALLGSRQEDIRNLYETGNWEFAQSIIEKYDIRYIVVGTLERGAYRIEESKFRRFLTLVFQQGDLVIFSVP